MIVDTLGRVQKKKMSGFTLFAMYINIQVKYNCKVNLLTLNIYYTVNIYTDDSPYVSLLIHTYNHTIIEALQ